MKKSTQPFVKDKVYKTTLKTVYGLTDAMIAELGEPDAYTKNPHYRSGPPSSLYLIARVEEYVEANAGRIAIVREERARRSERMTEVAAKRRDDLIAWAGTVEIKVAQLPADLRREAGEWYALRDAGRWGDDFWTGDITDGALIAYVRHQYTNYEALLGRLDGKPGGHDAYPIIKERASDLARLALVLAGQVLDHEQVGEDVRMTQLGMPTLPGLELL